MNVNESLEWADGLQIYEVNDDSHHAFVKALAAEVRRLKEELSQYEAWSTKDTVDGLVARAKLAEGLCAEWQDIAKTAQSNLVEIARRLAKAMKVVEAARGVCSFAVGREPLRVALREFDESQEKPNED